MAWTDERKAVLRRMAAAGARAAEIADELGVTRSAVIGAAHRYKVPLLVGSNGRVARQDPQYKPPVPGMTKRIRVPGPLDHIKRTTVPCRWPMGEVGRPGFHFCGDPSLPGKPYCEQHSKIAYRREK